MLAKIFGDSCEGSFVDVGAHHPTRFSNTYLFYLRGWRGINIDPLPGSRAEFERIRPNDINLELAVGDSPTPLVYHLFNEPALNGFDAKLSKSRDGLRGYRIVRKIEVPVRPLQSILAEYLPVGRDIDFLTVDVEGLDLSVLRSND